MLSTINVYDNTITPHKTTKPPHQGSIMSTELTTWNVDTAHTNVQFKVKHMGFFDVTGSFVTFGGTLKTNGEVLDGGSITADVDINSISTNNEQRDGHLKSDDFFNAEAYPKMSFNSTSISKNGANYTIAGELTIRNTTKKVQFDAVHAGKLIGMYGELRTGIMATTKINRKEFGLNWGALVEGVNVVSDDVEIILNVQLVKA